VVDPLRGGYREKTFTVVPETVAGMVHCPECDGEIADESDVEFVDLDAKMAGIFRSSKRFYVVACNNCGAAIGSGVAGGGG
jgi:predicted nucleic-acid-binding Zn-ribbon protein